MAARMVVSSKPCRLEREREGERGRESVKEREGGGIERESVKERGEERGRRDGAIPVSFARWELNTVDKVVGGVRVSHNVVPQDLPQKGGGEELVQRGQPKHPGHVLEGVVRGHERGHLLRGVLEGVGRAGGLHRGDQGAEFGDLGGGLQESGGGISVDALRVALVKLLRVGGGQRRRGERRNGDENRDEISRHRS